MGCEAGSPVYFGELGWDRIEVLRRAGIPRWLFEENAEGARVWVEAANHARAVKVATNGAA